MDIKMCKCICTRKYNVCTIYVYLLTKHLSGNNSKSILILVLFQSLRFEFIRYRTHFYLCRTCNSFTLNYL